MRTKAPTILLTTTALALGACTSLQSLPDLDRTADAGRAIRGSTYSLPMLTYDIAVTRTLASCGAQIILPPLLADSKDPGTTLEELWQGGLKISVTGEASPEMIVGERYRFNPAKLVGPTKTTNFNMTYWEGSDILKGVNSAMEDQTGPILADVASFGLAVASIVLGPAGAGVAAAGAGFVAAGAVPKARVATQFQMPAAVYALTLPASIQRFAADTLTHHNVLSEASKLKRQPTARELKVQRLTELLDAAAETKTLVVCTPDAASKAAQLEALGNNKKQLALSVKQDSREVDAYLKRAAIRPLTPPERKALADLSEKIDDSLREADDVQKQIDDIVGAIAATAKDRWPKTFNERDLTRLDTRDATDTFKALLTVDKREVVNAEKLAAALGKAENADLRKEFATWVAAYVWPDGSPKFKSDPATPPKPDETGCVATAAIAANVDKCLSHLLPAAVSLAPRDGHDLPTCVGGSQRNCLTFHNTEETLKQVGARDSRDRNVDHGLFVRPPEWGELKLCRANPVLVGGVAGAAAQPPQCLDKGGTVIAKAMRVPQLGQLRFVPLKNELFENSGLVLNLDKSGQPTDVSYVSSKAAGAAFAAAASKIATEGKTFADTRRKEAKEVEKERKTEADAQAKQDLADAAMAEAKTAADALGVDAVQRAAQLERAKDLQADADLAKAEAAQIEAKACLQAAISAVGVPVACPPK